MNCLLEHQHNVRQHEKKKTKYKKYEAGLTALRNLITSNNQESFVSAHKNRITGFCLFDTIILMDYIQTNYGIVHPKQIQHNWIALNAQWDPTTLIAVLFTRIEDCKIFAKAGEDPLTEKKILCSEYLAI